MMRIQISSLRSKHLILAGILLAIALAFSPCLKNELLYWDDDVHIWKNPTVQELSIENTGKIFTQTINQIYLPLTTLSFALEHQLAGFDPQIYHLDNLLLHLGVTALVFTLALSLKLPLAAAACAALLFGIHPMRVESVAWASERKDVLYGFFYMLALVGYLRYLKTGKAVPYMLALLCGLFSILAKPMALSLPLILCLMDWLTQRPFSRRTLWDKIPFFLYTLPIAWITYHLNARWAIHDIGSSILVWIWTFMFYLWKFLWPIDLTPAYALPLPIKLTHAPFLIATLLFTVILSAVVVFRKNRWFMFAGLYYLASIFFLLRFDQSADANTVADRFMYLPCVGLCLWLGKMLEENYTRLKGKNIYLTIGIAGLFAGLIGFGGMRTYQQCRIWTNDATLWQHAIRINPSDPLIYNNLAYYYYNKNAFDQALPYYDQSIALNGDYHVSRLTRGTIHFHQGRYDLAMADFNAAIALRPDLGSPHSNRAAIYIREGRYDLALEDLNAAIRLEGHIAAPYNNRGQIYMIRQQWDLALADFNHSTALDPASVIGYFNRAEVYRHTGDPDLALKDYLAILKIDPENQEAAEKMRQLRK